MKEKETNIESNTEIEKKIIEVLDKIRPYLENDGGSVKFNRFANGVVYVTVVGAWRRNRNCPYKWNTRSNKSNKWGLIPCFF